ncbi:hypothetical protein B0H16DRAFT_1569865 [Mycena metata]|uniref:Uncharacterized protein n=1 Tax=Mycena metata TaxID=1033252 RepID=A0AAD7MYP8_9AGAR|nr:hypothetical protein B0H16DRAFT_1569865 [Mycena metata]
MGRACGTRTLLPRILVPLRRGLSVCSMLCASQVLLGAREGIPSQRVEKAEWKHRRRSKFPLASAGACVKCGSGFGANTGFGVSFGLTGLQKV